MNLLKVVVLLVVAAAIAVAQGPTKLVDGTGSELIVAAGGKRYESTLTVAATSPATVVTAVTTKVQLIFCKNPAVASQTLTITDGNGVEYFPAVTMEAKSVLVMGALTVGLTFTNGVKLSSSAGTVACQIAGVQ